jgi:multidrug transporter EmrE-like cation transporter
MQLTWLALAIVCTVGYHLVLKLTPPGVNPLLSLMLTYALVTALFGAILLFSPGGFDWKQEVRAINWTAIALAVAIVGLDLGFLFLYRSGFEVSLGALVTQSAASLLLLAIGVAVFREKVSLANAAGLALCLAGLWLVHRR